MVRYKHSFANTVGLVHSLAGSGALVLLVMSEISDTLAGIISLFVFGIPLIQCMKINRRVKARITVLS